MMQSLSCLKRQRIRELRPVGQDSKAKTPAGNAAQPEFFCSVCYVDSDVEFSELFRYAFVGAIGPPAIRGYAGALDPIFAAHFASAPSRPAILKTRI